jgi:hypothetical protein
MHEMFAVMRNDFAKMRPGAHCMHLVIRKPGEVHLKMTGYNAL